MSVLVLLATGAAVALPAYLFGRYTMRAELRDRRGWENIDAALSWRPKP